MNQIKVSVKRHLAKTVSYRIISTLIGFLIMWAATGSIKIGAAFGVAELILKPVLYYLHERFWYRYMKYGLVEVKPIKKVKDLKEEPQIVEQPEKPKIKRLTYTKKAN
jgi:uncharacterized membrane protein